MTLIIVAILLLGYLLIATAQITNVNKSAVAMFVCALGWVIYICYGSDFVMSQHSPEYREYLMAMGHQASSVKYFICETVFLKYVGKAAAIVLFLLATMTIVEILNTNGCFDFFSEWIRTRNSKRLLWTITLATFVVSANLDNLTTTTMMLVVMHNIVQNRRQRMVIGTSIVLAANAGGCFTVIGDPLGVYLWGEGAVTATNFSAYLFLPSVIAWVLPTYLLGRQLPDHLDVTWCAAPYRGDDTRLNRWQRILMFFVGIGGLWFIPTFHNITKLSPFLGALCVLSVLWVVHEVFNRKLMNADQNIQRSIPRVLQYGAIQQILFVLAILLAMGMAIETGALLAASEWVDYHIHNVWIVGLISGVLSSVIDTFTVAMSNASFYDVIEGDLDRWWVDDDYMLNFVQNGAYWKLIAYTTAIGGCLFGYANMSGLALMKMEHVRVGWYLRHCTLKIMIGWLLGLAVLYAECELF